MLKTETRATRRIVHAVVLCDATVPGTTAPLPGALPVRTVFVPQGTPTCRVVELALAEVAVLGKNRIKLELPPNRDRPDARELAAITQQLMQAAQDSSSKGAWRFIRRFPGARMSRVLTSDVAMPLARQAWRRPTRSRTSSSTTWT